MATGPGGIGPGAGIPLTTEWLQAQKKLLKENKQVDATDISAADQSTLSNDAQKLSSTKDERMLQAMREELANLDTESETFMEEATEKLIDSVIDQEYGEHFKKKPGYGNLQEKLTQTVLDNPVSRQALTEFFELLLRTEDDGSPYDPDEDEEPNEENGSEDELDDEDLDEEDEDENE